MSNDPLDVQVGGSHYKGFEIQPAAFIHKNGIGFLAGNVIKYVTRYKSKNGKEDLLKAKHYIDLILALEYPESHEQQQPRSNDPPPNSGSTGPAVGRESVPRSFILGRDPGYVYGTDRGSKGG